MKRETGEKVFTNWTVKELIGQGAFGKVYRIEREEFGTVYQAAMKKIVIPQSQEDIEDAVNEGMDEQSVTSYFRSFVEEIVGEFKLMAQLKGHTNIVSYEDHMVIPHEDGIGWDILIRMELLKSLKNASAEKNMTEAEVIKLGRDICNALEICEKMNIIHRDIKPENIFVTSLGEYKLGDFGIARTAEKTMSNLSKKGTYTYMAPEVYKGEAYNATVDIYSLGIVMYRFMNYNRAPFLPPYPQPINFSDREAAMTRRISEEPMPAPACGGRELKRIILKACAYRPSARYQSPAEMRSDLEKLLRDLDEDGGLAKQRSDTTFWQSGEDKAADLPEEATVTMAGQETPQKPQEILQEEDVTVAESAASATAAVEKEASAAGTWQGRPEVSAEDEDVTVSIFGDRTEASPQEKTVQPVPVPAPQPEPEKPKKSKRGLFIGIGAAALAAAAAAGIFLTMGGSSHSEPSGEFDGFSYMETSEDGKYDDLLTGIDVEDTAAEEFVPLSEKYLYGHYLIGQLDGTVEKSFLEDMETMTVGDMEVGVIPCEIYCFPEGTLYNTHALYDLIDETGGDISLATPSYASRTYLDDLDITKEEVFEGIVYTLFGDAVRTNTHAFYEEYIKGQGDTAELVFIEKESLKKKSLVGYYRMKDSVMEFSWLDMDENGQLVLRPLSYEIAFSNSDLMVSQNNMTRKLRTYSATIGSGMYSFDGYADSMAQQDPAVYYIWCGISSSDRQKFLTDSGAVEMDGATLYFTDGWRAQYATGTMGPGNQIQIQWEQQGSVEDPYARREEEGSLTAYYLDCDYLGCILKVDGKDYFFQKTETEYYAGLVGNSVIDAELDEEALQMMSLTQMEILKEIQDAFAAEGFAVGEDVDINEKTGRITLNDGILFDVGSAELSEEGKEYLSHLFAVLNQVILEGGYEECLDEIIVEGHTDSTGDYEENQELSEARAYAVDDYCYEIYPHVSNYIDTVGRSNDELIYDENGNENRDASRRVVFRITLDADAFADYAGEDSEDPDADGMQGDLEDSDLSDGEGETESEN